jgi:hypothetical protein
VLETERSIMTDAPSLANNLERVISRIIDGAAKSRAEVNFAQLEYFKIQS